MALLIFYSITALGFLLLCSIAEAVLMSLTPSYPAYDEDKATNMQALARSQWKRRVQRLGLIWEDPDGSAKTSAAARARYG